MSGFSDAPGTYQLAGWTTVVGLDGQPLDVYTVEGTDPTIPPEIRKAYLQEHISGVLRYQRELADKLLQLLLVDGIDQNIQLEDMERLCNTKKLDDDRSPRFVRRIVVELLVALRPKK